MRKLKQILMDRDGISADEAAALIEAARDDLMSKVEEGDFFGAEEICADHFGLEPDFLDELLFSI